MFLLRNRRQMLLWRHIKSEKLGEFNMLQDIKNSLAVTFRHFFLFCECFRLSHLHRILLKVLWAYFIFLAPKYSTIFQKAAFIFFLKTLFSSITKAVAHLLTKQIKRHRGQWKWFVLNLNVFHLDSWFTSLQSWTKVKSRGHDQHVYIACYLFKHAYIHPIRGI